MDDGRKIIVGNGKFENCVLSIKEWNDIIVFWVVWSEES